MVYAKFMSRGFSNEYFLVVAPTARALSIFAAQANADNPSSRTVRIRATSQIVRDFKALCARMSECGEEATDVIYVLPDGQRDFHRGAVWVGSMEWISRMDS